MVYHSDFSRESKCVCGARDVASEIREAFRFRKLEGSIYAQNFHDALSSVENLTELHREEVVMTAKNLQDAFGTSSWLELEPSRLRALVPFMSVSAISFALPRLLLDGISRWVLGREENDEVETILGEGSIFLEEIMAEMTPAEERAVNNYVAFFGESTNRDPLES